MSNKILVALAILIANASAACAGPGTLDVGYEGDEEGYVKALIAADAWNGACQENLVNVHRGSADIRVIQQATRLAPDRLGETRFAQGNIFVGPKPIEIVVTSGKDEMVVLAHEFGHALGIHEHAESGLMRASVSRTVLDPATGYTTILEGTITPKMCARVAR